MQCKSLRRQCHHQVLGCNIPDVSTCNLALNKLIQANGSSNKWKHFGYTLKPWEFISLNDCAQVKCYAIQNLEGFSPWAFKEKCRVLKPLQLWYWKNFKFHGRNWRKHRFNFSTNSVHNWIQDFRVSSESFELFCSPSLELWAKLPKWKL